MAKRSHISTRDAIRRCRRQAGQKPQRSVYLIVCEGETEEAYFCAVKKYHRTQITANLKIVRHRSDPVRLVEEGKRKNEKGDFDHVFCVIDGDKKDRTAAARKCIAKRNDVELIVSFPCFEVWLLLHSERCDAPFVDCEKVYDRLREHLSAYVKGHHYDFAKIMDKIDEAIRNAQWLASRGIANPSTDVHRLLQRIRPVPCPPEKLIPDNPSGKR